MQRSVKCGLVITGVLIIICAGIAIVLAQRFSEPNKPKVTYVMPKKTGNTSINTGSSAPPMVTALPKSEQQGPVESNVEDSFVDVPDADFELSGNHLDSSDDTTVLTPVTTKLDDSISDEELQRQLDEVAKAKAYMEQATVEFNSLMSDFFDMKAKDLRSKSISERLDYLSQYRASLEDNSDYDSPGIINEVVDMFIVSMNERGVYFE